MKGRVEMETEMEIEMETEMDIEWEPNRKELFQGQVCTADSHCQCALRTLKIVSAEMQKLGGDQKPPCVEEAQRKLEDAGMELGLALANMGAARHIALRGGGGVPSPATPLKSVDDLAWDPDVCRALEWLDKAEALATEAHDMVEAARCHLGTAALLRVLGEDEEDAEGGAPWEHTPCRSEQLDGVMVLQLALLKAEELVDATAAASKAAFGVSGRTD